MDLNKKIYISLIAFLIICFLFIFFLIYPKFVNIKNSSNQITDKENNLFLLTEKERNLKQAEIIHQIYKDDIGKIDKLLVDSRVPIEFVRFLESMASELNLSIKISSLSTPEREGDLWPSFSLSIATGGSFLNSMKFLEKLENSPYLVEMLSLRINESKEKESRASFSYSIKVFTNKL